MARTSGAHECDVTQKDATVDDDDVVYACYETPAGADLQDDTPGVPGDLYNSQVGSRGCCRTGPGRITAKLECPRHSNAIDTYVWVDAAMHDGQCHAYALRYKMK